MPQSYEQLFEGVPYSKAPFVIPSAEAAVDLAPLRNGGRPRIKDWIDDAITKARRAATGGGAALAHSTEQPTSLDAAEQ